MSEVNRVNTEGLLELVFVLNPEITTKFIQDFKDSI